MRCDVVEIDAGIFECFFRNALIPLSGRHFNKSILINPHREEIKCFQTFLTQQLVSEVCNIQINTFMISRESVRGRLSTLGNGIRVSFSKQYIR